MFYQHPAWFISLYNNSEDARFFHEFTGIINYSRLTNQNARIYLVIWKAITNLFELLWMKIENKPTTTWTRCELSDLFWQLISDWMKWFSCQLSLRKMRETKFPPAEWGTWVLVRMSVLRSAAWFSLSFLAGQCKQFCSFHCVKNSVLFRCYRVKPPKSRVTQHLLALWPINLVQRGSLENVRGANVNVKGQRFAASYSKVPAIILHQRKNAARGRNLPAARSRSLLVARTHRTTHHRG